MKRPALAALALLTLLAALAIPARAQELQRRDEPPVFVIDFPPDRDVTVRIVWDEASDAPIRWLRTRRAGGVIYYDPGPRRPFYVVDNLDLDDWRPGDELTLCRLWPDPDGDGSDDVTSCHARTPWADNSVFLPLTR